MHQRKKKTKQILAVFVIMLSLTLLFIGRPQINMAIKNVVGISQDSGVEVAEDNNISNELNLVSRQSDKEITMTKFVSTKKKVAFDYHFQIDDKELKVLLEKQMKADNYAQFIDISLFAEGDSKDLLGGVFIYSTFRVEGNIFYGSVVSTFIDETIPENAKLTLHINRLWWQDQEEFEVEKAQALAAGDKAKPFTIDTALEYTGNWTFNINYEPLTQTSIPEIINSKNISTIDAVGDVLQTTIQFVVPLKEDSVPAATIYKNGVKTENLIAIEMFDVTTGEIELTLNLSSLEKENTYKIQVNEIDFEGNPIEEIGYFELKNK